MLPFTLFISFGAHENIYSRKIQATGLDFSDVKP